MPHSRTNYIAEARWNDPKKVNYRYDAVISPYQSFFGQSLPKNKQYWTLCGAHFDEHGPMQEGSEFLQLTESKLITPQQFHGVDREDSIIKENQQIHPEATWHCGDAIEAVKAAILRKNFNPAIFHFDGVNETQVTAEYVARLFRMFDDFVPDELLFVITLVMKNPYRPDKETHGNEFVEELLKHYEPPTHWRLLDTYYWYGGAGTRSNTVMGSFAWIKKKHDPSDIQRGEFKITVSAPNMKKFCPCHMSLKS